MYRSNNVHVIIMFAGSLPSPLPSGPTENPPRWSTKMMPQRVKHGSFGRQWRTEHSWAMARWREFKTVWLLMISSIMLPATLPFNSFTHWGLSQVMHWEFRLTKQYHHPIDSVAQHALEMWRNFWQYKFVCGWWLDRVLLTSVLG